MAGERPILGLEVGRVISPVHDRRSRNEMLAMVDDPSARVVIGIEGVIVTLQDRLNISMPFEHLLALNEPLGRELRWQQVFHPKALSALYLGFDPEKSPETNPPFQQALALIEAVSTTTESLTDPTKQTVRPRWMDVTGITRDSSGEAHIVSVSYALNGQNEARRVYASAPINFQIDPGYHGDQYSVKDCIPLHEHPLGFPQSYPILTEGMREATGHEQLAHAVSSGRNGPSSFTTGPWFVQGKFIERMIEEGSPGSRALGPGTESASGLVRYDWQISYPNSIAAIS